MYFIKAMCCNDTTICAAMTLPFCAAMIQPFCAAMIQPFVRAMHLSCNEIVKRNYKSQVHNFLFYSVCICVRNICNVCVCTVSCGTLHPLVSICVPVVPSTVRLWHSHCSSPVPGFIALTVAPVSVTNVTDFLL